jgi:peptidoglycan/xylan/chitin deacetylase (PgdA/CDA1 family)
VSVRSGPGSPAGTGEAATTAAAAALGAVAGLAGLAALAAADRGVPQLLRREQVARLRAAVRSAGAVVLTYDDGPSATVTPRILDVLGRAGVRATFFVTGHHVERHGEVVARMHADGHEIASHGLDHRHPWRLAPGAAARQARDGLAAVREIGGNPTLYRPPYGKPTMGTLSVLARRGVRPVYWTIDGGDTAPALGDPSALPAAIRRAGGGVVLLHDLARSPERDEYVTEATEAVLDGCAGMRFLTVGALLAREVA